MNPVYSELVHGEHWAQGDTYRLLHRKQKQKKSQRKHEIQGRRVVSFFEMGARIFRPRPIAGFHVHLVLKLFAKGEGTQDTRPRRVHKV